MAYRMDSSTPTPNLSLHREEEDSVVSLASQSAREATLSAASLRYLPRKQNVALSAFAIVFQLAGLGLTPLIWAWSGWAFFVYLLVYGYATVMGWLLIHEAIHYKLLNDRQANDRLGRLHAILFGCPFHILKVGI